MRPALLLLALSACSARPLDLPEPIRPSSPPFDLATSDLAAPDLAVPDLANYDLGVVDLAVATAFDLAGGDLATTFEQFCAAYYELLAERAAGCSGGSVDDWRTALAGSTLCANIHQQILAGHMGFDPARAADCLAQVPTAQCHHLDYLRFNWDEACYQATPGLVDEGGACDTALDCKRQRYPSECDHGWPASSCGVCRSSSDYCPFGFGGGLGCFSFGTCGPGPSTPGCWPWQVCENDRYGREIGCFNLPCADDQYGSRVDGGALCYARKPPGASCAGPLECQFGSSCENEVCVPWPRIGEPCSVGSIEWDPQLISDPQDPGPRCLGGYCGKDARCAPPSPPTCP